MGQNSRRVHLWIPCTHRCFLCRWTHLLVLFILIPVIYQTLLYIYPDSWEDWEIRLRNRRRDASGCNCTLPSQWIANTSSLFPLNSTCSDKRTFYQRNQNVISFSLHLGPRRRKALLSMYVEGLELNAKAAQKLYPNFTIRVYTDLQLTPENPFCSVLCDYSHVFWCDVWEIPRSRLVHPKFLNPTRMMVWRSLPLGDPTVDVFLSRDLDSVVSQREVAAVSDWLHHRPPRGIHVMRDHKMHGSPIMGGMWGARNQWLSNATKLQTDIILASEALDYYFAYEKNDQHVFNKVISPRDMLVHDSYHCDPATKLYQSVWRPFPTQRKGIGPYFTDFVGNPDLGKQIHKFSPCPVACRPSYGQDWEYC